MQFYLLLILSGVISGSTVLAQEVIGYASPGCTGSTTFTYTATTRFKCNEATNPGTMSVNLPQNVRCGVYEGPECTGNPQLIYVPGCVTVQFPTVGSYACIHSEGSTV